MKHHLYFDYGYESNDQRKIELIKKNHFDGVFLYWREPLDQVVEDIRKAGLTIETMHLPFDDCNDLWLEEMTSPYLEVIYRGIEDAHRLNIPTVIFHISSTANPPAVSEVGLARFKAILSKCEEYQINLALENLRRLDYLDFIFDRCSSPFLKFCFDSGHANAFTNNIDAFPWEKYQKYLICLHLHDNNGLRDQHLPPFKGTINWELLMKNLHNCHYQGPLTVEGVFRPYLNLNEEDYLEQLQKSLVQLESLWPDEKS